MSLPIVELAPAAQSSKPSLTYEVLVLIAKKRREEADELLARAKLAEKRAVVAEMRAEKAHFISLTCRTRTGVRNESSILATLYEHHIADFDGPGGGEGLMRYFTTKEARVLRLVCHEFLETVEVHKWFDFSTLIIGRGLTSWRKSFPSAVAANVSGTRLRLSHHFAPLAGIKALRTEKFSPGIADIVKETLVHLEISGFESKENILGALAVLSGRLRTLEVGCYYFGDECGPYLHGLRVFKDRRYYSGGPGAKAITEALFAHLRGLEELTIMGIGVGSQYLTSFALSQLRGLRSLCISSPEKVMFSDDLSFSSLRGLDSLSLDGGTLPTCITDDSLRELTGLAVLSLYGPYILPFTESGFSYLKGLRSLHIFGSSWDATESLDHLVGIEAICAIGATPCMREACLRILPSATVVAKPLKKYF